MSGTLLCFCQFLLSDGRLLMLATKAARAEGDNKCFLPLPQCSSATMVWPLTVTPELAVVICTSATIRGGDQ